MLDTITLGGYTINFLGAATENNLQTWTYSILKNENPMPAISSMTLELCYKPFHTVHKFFGPGSIVIGRGTPCLPYAGRAIKWEQLSNKNAEAIYSFTLEGNFAEENKQIAISTGPYCYRGYITGPSCRITNIVPMEINNKEELARSMQNMINTLPPFTSSRGIKIF